MLDELDAREFTNRNTLDTFDTRDWDGVSREGKVLGLNAVSEQKYRDS